LELISESVALVEQYLAGPDDKPSQSLFVEDLLRQDAVLSRMEILADAAHLSSELKARHTDIPWRRITDFRTYWPTPTCTSKSTEIWRAVVNDLPTLKAVVQQELDGTSAT
jgi:uncharacterized protein with HEPN domain